jgi:hypothetical protein
VSGTLEQQPSPECARRLTQCRCGKTVEMEAREEGTASEVGAGHLGFVEALLDQVEDPAQPVRSRHVSDLRCSPVGSA